MGLPAIDQSLDKLLVAMEAFPNVAILGDTISFARMLGLLLALCVGSYECWMMMLGRRGMDVMKLLRIIGISMYCCPVKLQRAKIPSPKPHKFEVTPKSWTG